MTRALSPPAGLALLLAITAVLSAIVLTIASVSLWPVILAVGVGVIAIFLLVVVRIVYLSFRGVLGA